VEKFIRDRNIPSREGLRLYKGDLDNPLTKREFLFNRRGGRKRIKTQVKDFLVNFNKLCYTAYPDGTLQCKRYRRRSLGDIYSILYYYNDGKVTQKRVMQALYDLCKENKISRRYCPDVYKRVFWHRNSTSFLSAIQYVGQDFATDENGLKLEDFNFK